MRATYRVGGRVGGRDGTFASAGGRSSRSTVGGSRESGTVVRDEHARTTRDSDERTSARRLKSRGRAGFDGAARVQTAAPRPPPSEEGNGRRKGSQRSEPRFARPLTASPPAADDDDDDDDDDRPSGDWDEEFEVAARSAIDRDDLAT